MTTDLFKLPDDFAVPHGAELMAEIIHRNEMHLDVIKVWQFLEMAVRDFIEVNEICAGERR